MKSVSNRRLLLAAAISLIAHALFFLIMPRFFPEQTAKKNQMAALQLWMKEKEAPIIIRPLDDKKPVVRLERPKNSTRPDKADYFADHDQMAKKETKSLNQNLGQDDGQKSVAAQDEEPENELKGQATPPKKNPENDVGYQKHRAQLWSRPSKDDPLGIRLKFHRPRFNESKARAKAFDDYLPNVEEGHETDLNTWQWRHAPFFNRIKTRISQTWSPQSQILRYDPNGSLLGHKDRVTVMKVSIDRQGFLKDLSIADESGVPYLDEEAVRAFKEAAPFLYPPQELFDGKDEFSFTFAFHLQQNRGFSFDFNW